MTAAKTPAVSESSDMKSDANNQVHCEVYQRRQHYDQSEAKHALSETVQEHLETCGAKMSTRHPDICPGNYSADAMSLDGRPSQQSRSSGLFGLITDAVGAFIPGKARQKDEHIGDKHRRPPTPEFHESTRNLQDQAKHKASDPHEHVPKPQIKEKRDSDRPLESKQMTENNEKREAAKLRDQLHRVQVEAKQETDALLDRVQQLQVKSETDALKLQRVSMHAENLENVVRALRVDLQKANTRVTALGKTVAENEAIITQANATAVSRLASNVSRGFTDDMIKEALKKFFQTDFLSWCADLCAERIEDAALMARLHMFMEPGILSSSKNYLDGPDHLKFKADMPDGSSPLVMLQAALATRLCALYLSDAYFLAKDRHTTYDSRLQLFHFEQQFRQAQPDAAISWRIQTVECLERSTPITECSVKREVDRFVEDYFFLLSADKYDTEASKDLVQIFVDFASLALKLWKTRADVRWYNVKDFQDRPFQLGSPWVEVEPTSVSTMGQRLNGRPIALIIRPMILSRTLSKDGDWEQVVWLKALAWVSGEDEFED
ncbi:hypothetical protein V8C44DRAFT_231633 [Trichoderma aethiopicum]